MEKVREQLKILSKRHSLQIISMLLGGPRNITQISEELGAPYTTTQQRVDELEWADLVEVEPSIDEASKRAVRLVRLVNFRIELSPRSIQAIVKGGDERVLRVV